MPQALSPETRIPKAPKPKTRESPEDLGLVFGV